MPNNPITVMVKCDWEKTNRYCSFSWGKNEFTQ